MGEHGDIKGSVKDLREGKIILMVKIVYCQNSD